jgi:hypothetical protein
MELTAIRPLLTLQPYPATTHFATAETSEEISNDIAIQKIISGTSFCDVVLEAEAEKAHVSMAALLFLIRNTHTLKLCSF